MKSTTTNVKSPRDNAKPLRGVQSKQDRLRSHLLSEIATGVLGPGDILVPEPQLAELMHVSRTTVRQTLEDLETQGLVRRVQGKGTFVADRPTGETAAHSAAYAIVVLDVRSNYYTSLLSGFEEACSQTGQAAVVCNSGNSIDRQANHLMRLLSHRVSGVVLNATSETVTQPYHVALLQDAGIPVVLLHRSIPDVHAPVLEMPAEEIGRTAARLILNAGHRHAAFIETYRADVALRTEAGFRPVLVEAGLGLPAHRVIYGDSREWCGTTPNFQEYDLFLEKTLSQLLAQPDRPTVIYAGEATIAEHLFLVAQRLGLRVPQDLSILCFGGAHRDGAILKRLTAITIDEVAAGKKAVELLQEMRSGARKIRDSEVFRLPLAVSTGDSLGPVPRVK